MSSEVDGVLTWGVKGARGVVVAWLLMLGAGATCAQSYKPNFHVESFGGYALSLSAAGSAVAIGGLDADRCGLVKLVNARTGSQELSLRSPIPCADQWPLEDFGVAVSLTETHIAVTAPAVHRVYLFDRSGTLINVIAEPGPVPTPGFGASVALDGRTLAVGGGADGVILFDIESGQATRLLVSGYGPAGPTQFGSSVALGGGIAVVGDLMTERVEAFETESGASVWARDMPYVPGIPGRTGLSGVGGSIVVDGAEVYVAGARYRSKIAGYRLDARTGRITRKFRGPSRGANAIAVGDGLVVTGREFAAPPSFRGVGRLNVFDRPSGTLRSTIPLDDSFFSNLLLGIADGTVVVGDIDRGSFVGFRRGRPSD